jgi:flagella basal body P-ring formation protein FlgA
MKHLWAYTGVFFLGFILLAGKAAGGIIVQLPQTATVVGPQVTLGEIAEVIGDNKALMERARRLTVGKAAPAGDRVNVTQGYIKIALRREGYSLDDFAFSGEEKVEVLTQSQAFDPEDLLPQIKGFILDQTKESPENVDVKMEGKEKKIVLPAGEVKANIRPSFSGKYEGSVFLAAELEVDHHLIRVLPLRIMVEVYHSIVATTQRVEKGVKFTRENVGLTRVPSSKIINGGFRQLTYVLNRTAAMPLPPGTVIRVSDIYDPPAVRHGEVVLGIVQKGNVELSVQVRAIEDGKAGDSIRVENTESHKVLRGKVLDEKTVLIGPEDSK